MFSLAYNLTKNDVEILPVEISSRKDRANNVDFSIIKITSKIVSENNVDFLTREITSKNVRGSNADFSIIKIISKKVRWVRSTIFPSAKLHRKSTWKWYGNLSKFGLRRFDVISTWNQCRFDLVYPLA